MVAVRLLPIALLLFCAHAFATSVPTSVTYQGKIIKPDTTPLEAASVDFNVQILNPAGTCILYEEDFTGVDMTGSGGLFSLDLGTGTRSDGQAHTFIQVFENNRVFPSTGPCGGGYTPLSEDHRQVRLEFNDGSPIVVSPNAEIAAVPYAFYAQSLQGMTAAEFLQVNTGGANTLSQANLEGVFSTPNYTELLALLAGTSTNYMQTSPGADVSFNNNKITDVTDPTNAQDAATKNYADTSIGGTDAAITGVTGAAGDGRVLSWNQAAARWEAVDLGASSVVNTPAGDVAATDVQAAINELDTEKLALAGGTMSGDIDMNGNNIVNSGYITMNDDNYLHLGRYDDTAEAALVATPLGATHEGVMWWDEEDNTIEYWDGSGVVVVGSGSGSGTLDDAYDNGAATVTVDGTGGGDVVWNLTSTNDFKIQDGGADAFVVDDSGKVGVGGASSGAYLEVLENIVINPASNFGLLQFNDDSNALKWSIGNTNSGSIQNGFSFFEHGGSPGHRFSIAEGGNVGVGTATPGAKFTVHQTGASNTFGQSAFFLSGGNRYFDFDEGMIVRGVGTAWATRFTATSGLNADGQVVAIYQEEGTDGDTMTSPTPPNSPIAVFLNDGRVGIATDSPTAGTVMDFAGTGAALSSIIVPRDTTANRPSTGVNGMVRYNSTTNKFEGYENGAWTDFVQAAGSSNTLDGAYDEGGAGAGRAVTVDTGAIQFTGSNAADETLEVTNSGNGGALLVENTGTGTSFRVNDEAADTTPFVIDDAGNVGVGRTTAVADLHIAGNFISGNINALPVLGGASANHSIGYTSTSAQFALGSWKTSGHYGNTLHFYQSDGDSEGVYTLVAGSRKLGGFEAWGSDGTDFDRSAGILFHSGATPSAGVASGDIRFFTNNNAGTYLERMRLDEEGDLGVGTMSPGGKLHVAGGELILDGVGAYLDYKPNNVKCANNEVLKWIDANDRWECGTDNAGAGAQTMDETYDQGTNTVAVDAQDMIWNLTSTQDFKIQDNGTDAFVVLDDGTVGVGTNAPASQFQVVNNQNAETIISVSNTDTGTSAASRIGALSDSVYISMGAGSSSWDLGGLTHFADRGFLSTNIGEGLDLVGFEATADIRFYSGGATTANERMRITAAGNIGIGTATPTTGTVLDITGAGAAKSSIIIPRDTTANRPTTGVNGMVRYNSTTEKFEGYENGAWTDFVQAAGSSNTLDGAYDEGGAGVGRAITVDTGAIQFTGSNAADETLEVTNSGNGGVALLENTGTGDSFRVNDEATDTTPFVIDDEGNVGVGTATPADPLHIAKHQTATTSLQVQNNSTGNASAAAELLLDLNTTHGAYFRTNYASYTRLGTLDNDLAFEVGSTEFMRIQETTGNVGIGITGPGGKLHVSGGELILDGTGAYLDYKPNNVKCADGEVLKWDDGNDRWDCGTDTAGGGAGTLDASYDVGGAGAGRAITVDTGAVQLTGSNAADETLEVTNSGNGGALLVENTGTGYSLRVNDEAADATPFVINATGNVGVGTTAPAGALEVESSGVTLVLDNPSGDTGMQIRRNGTVFSDINQRAGFVDLIARADDTGINFGTTRDDGSTITYRLAMTGGVDTANVNVNDSNLNVNSGQLYVRQSDGSVGFGTSTPAAGAVADFSGTGAALSSVVLPRDTTANRPSTGVNGMIRYNVTTNTFEGYENGAWVDMRGGGSFGTGNSGFVGALNYATTTNCRWTGTSGSWANFAADAQCPGPSLTGAALAPTTALTPAIQFATLPAGRYRVVASGTQFSTSTATACLFAISDGTQREGVTKTFFDSIRYQNIVVGEFTYSSAQTNINFNVQYLRNSGSNTCELVNDIDDQKLTISVTRIDGNTSAIQIADNDGDTVIQSEESADEDILRFDTAGVERMNIDASGNINVSGSFVPTGTVDFSGATIVDDSISIDDLDFASGDGINIPTATSNPTGTTEGQFYYNSSTDKFMVYDGGAWQEISSASGALVQDDDNDTMIQVQESADEDMIRFDTAGNERMIIDNSGNVGIGVASPSEKLDVYGNFRVQEEGAGIWPFIAVDAYSDDSVSEFHFRRYRNTVASPAAALDNDAVGYINARAYNGTQDEATASIAFRVDGTDVTGSGNHPGGEIMFRTRGETDTGQFGQQAQMIIRNNGNVGIGTLVPNEKLTVEGAISMDQLTVDPTGTAGYGALYVKNDGNLYYRDGAGDVRNLTPTGGYEQIGSTQTVSGTAANITFTSIPNDYDELYLSIEGWDCVSQGNGHLDLSTDNGSTFLSGQIAYTGVSNDGTTVSTVSGENLASLQFARNVGTNDFMSGWIKIEAYQSGFVPVIESFTADDNESRSLQASLYNALSADIDAFRVRCASGNLDGGTFKLYGKRSGGGSTLGDSNGVDVPTLASAPSTPDQGQIYYNTSDDKLYVWNGSAWQEVGSGAGGGGGDVSFSAYKSGNQTVSSGVPTKVTFETEEFDSNSNFASSRFTPTVAGKYIFTGSVHCSHGSSTACYAMLYKNGVQESLMVNRDGVGVAVTSHIFEMNGTTDYVELYGQTTGGSTIYGTSSTLTYFTGALIGGGSTLGDSNGVDVPTLASAPSSPDQGQMYYNTGDDKLYVWNGSAWKEVGSGAGAGGGGQGPSFSVHKNGTDQTVVASTRTLLTWGTETFDTNNEFSSDRFTPSVAGTYLFTAKAQCEVLNSVCFVYIAKNGVDVAVNRGSTVGSGGYHSAAEVTQVVEMNGTTDYVEAYILVAGGTTVQGDYPGTFFSGSYVGSSSGLGDSNGIDVPTLASAPSSPDQGQMYYNTGDDKLYVWNGSAWNEVGSGAGGGGLLNIQTFTANGTYTPTAGTQSIKVIVTGGGGGGAGSNNNSDGGGGGGAGATAITFISSVAASYPVTIGAGGAGGVGIEGSDGGQSSFGTITAQGGFRGYKPANADGGIGGSVTANATISIPGGGGTSGSNVNTEQSGTGGASYWGGGGQGWAGGQNLDGVDGQAPGSGGGGGLRSSTTENGGDGADGIVVVYEYGGGGGSGDAITDADDDTKIQVEETADEDIIRFDTANVERVTINASGAVNMTGDLTANSFTGDGSGLTNIGASAIADNSITVGDLDFASTNGINIPSLAAAPGTPTAGQSYFNTTDNRLYFYDGTGWVAAGGNAGTIGMIAAFPMATCPSGWIAADGSAISRTTYSSLFTSISTMYGVGDGSTTFNLPDYRGQFLRGTDGGAGTDPDAGSRTDRGDGTTGDAVGTKQADEFKSHSHTQSFGSISATRSWATSAGGAAGWTTSGTPQTATTGGNETRPTNINVVYCISYTGGATAGEFVADGSTPFTGNLRLNDNWLSNDGGNEGIRIDDDGKVGVGTGSPDEMFTVQGDTWASIMSRVYSNSEFGGLILSRARGTQAGALAVADDDTIGTMTSRAYNGTGWGEHARIDFEVDGATVGVGDAPGRIVMKTTPDGTATPQTRMTIKEDGFIGVGLTNPATKLHVMTNNNASPEGFRVESPNGSRVSLFSDMNTNQISGITEAGDAGLFFTDGTIETGALVIAPWTAENVGLRMNSEGFVEIKPETSTATASEQYGLRVTSRYNVADSSYKQGVRSDTTADHTSGTVDNLNAFMATSRNLNVGTVANAAGLWARVDNSNASGTITNAFGVYIAGSNNAGTITNDYGLYQAGTTSKNYFAGNVGIGTDDPAGKLTVEGNAIGLTLKAGSSADHVYMRFYADSAAQSTRSAWFGYGGAGTNHLSLTNEMAGGNIVLDPNGGIVSVPGTNISADRGYAAKAGNSGGFSGNTFHINWASPNADVWIDSTRIGTIATLSDYRYKYDVIDFDEPALDNIMKLRPVKYRWKDKGAFEDDGLHHSGFIAHELKEVLPTAVNGEKDQKDENGEDIAQNIVPLEIFPTIVKAIQELYKKVLDIMGVNDDQDREIASLKEENEAKEERIQNLEKENQELKDRFKSLEERIQKLEK